MVQALKALTSLLLLRIADANRYPSVLSAVRHTTAVTFSDVIGTMTVFILCAAFVAQNLLLFTAAKYLDTTVYLVFSQLKTLAAAVFAVLMAKRNISPLQWASLFLLIAGVALLQVNRISSHF
jgi:multidrug transporter EmrE-like cation transporter